VGEAFDLGGRGRRLIHGDHGDAELRRKRGQKVALRD